MIDPSITSPIFLLCLLCGPLLMAKNLSIRSYSFLIVSLGFFILTIGSWQSAVAIVFFVSFPFFYAKAIQKYYLTVWPAIIVQLAVFIYLNKYMWVLGFFNIPFPEMIQFLGVSYILFRQLDVLFQVRAKFVTKVHAIDYLNYLFSFWTILAGPIQRYRQFIQEFYSDKQPLSDDKALLCFHRAANGMIKILIIGPVFLFLSDTSFYNFISNDSSVILQGSPIYLLGILYCFPLYVYFNFSGYCDVVISMARWAGFSIPENFDRPYISRDMIEMWRRWHITLSQWVRDYVYQPLFKFFLSGPLRNHLSSSQYISIFITFFLVGIWHGATINLVVFGLLQGSGMAISMIYRDIFKKKLGTERYKSYYNSKWVINAERFVTLNFWCFTFLFYQYDLLNISELLLSFAGVR